MIFRQKRRKQCLKEQNFLPEILYLNDDSLNKIFYILGNKFKKLYCLLLYFYIYHNYNWYKITKNTEKTCYTPHNKLRQSKYFQAETLLKSNHKRGIFCSDRQVWFVCQTHNGTEKVHSC